MKITAVESEGITLSLVEDIGFTIKSSQDILDIMANAPSPYIVLREDDFSPEFFDLSTRVAGDILQKCSNYSVRLAIIGDYGKFTSKSLRDFIYESNRKRDHLFVGSLDEVRKIWDLG